MRDITRNLRLAASTALLAALVLGASAAAAGDSPSYDPRTAHAETDRNADGQVDREEFHHRMVEVFFHADRDKDGFMTFAEAERDLAITSDLGEADTDEDGRISLYEFVAVRFYDFDTADTDEDGHLSVEEVIVIFEVKGS
jgi:Ca2+-binding EF-hand superfamily protein